MANVLTVQDLLEKHIKPLESFPPDTASRIRVACSRRLCLDKNVTGPINNDSGMAVKVHAIAQFLIHCSSK